MSLKGALYGAGGGSVDLIGVVEDDGVRRFRGAPWKGVELVAGVSDGAQVVESDGER